MVDVTGAYHMNLVFLGVKHIAFLSVLIDRFTVYDHHYIGVY